MNTGREVKNLGGFRILYLLLIFMVGCSQTGEPCPIQPPDDLSGVLAYAQDDQLPFQFPLDELGNDNVRPSPPANFCKYNCNEKECEYHAAEDYHLPAGTPVYAMANGTISFSGPMGGYGWLIIIDHPQANLYSLYGHLSPSRWRLEAGDVQKGDLIAYLGDPDENGGSPKRPLVTHLHFGTRVGQRNDYPGMGEWRWQAGWIKPCPQDLGWLKPSLVLISQDINIGEQYKPTAGFLAKWWFDILFSGIYIFGGISTLIYAEAKKKPLAILASGIVFSIAAWAFTDKGVILKNVLLVLAVIFLSMGIYKLIRGRMKKSQAE